jgi:hypothetical protein
MSSDPKKMVEQFLDKNGYNFEMKVAKELRNVGFQVLQSFYYNDPTTKIAREIDIIASFTRVIGDVSFNVYFLIECKYAKTPWVLFTSPVVESKTPPYFSIGSKWMECLKNETAFSSLFQENKKAGYGITVSDNGNDDAPCNNNAYKAIQTLLNFLKSETKHQLIVGAKPYALFVPVIAIRGKLFDVFLNDGNEVQCSEINEAQLFYKENIGNLFPKIHLITDENISEYAKMLWVDCNKIVESPYITNDLIYNYLDLSSLFLNY